MEASPIIRNSSPLNEPDNISNNSRGSFNFPPSFASTGFNSDSESNGTGLSVREMIKHYNTVAKINTQLKKPFKPNSNNIQTSKSYFQGVNDFGYNNPIQLQESGTMNGQQTLQSSRSCNSFRQKDCCCGGNKCRNRRNTYSKHKEYKETKLYGNGNKYDLETQSPRLQIFDMNN